VISALAGILLLLKALDSPKLWMLLLSGILLGLSFLMKQPGIVFAIFGGLYLLGRDWPRKSSWKELMAKVGCYGAGVLLPFALTCLIISLAGVFKTFWFWVFDYAGEYASEVSFSIGLQILMKTFTTIASPAVEVWIIAGLGFATLLWDRRPRIEVGFIVGFSLISLLAVCPGFFFREHYFIMVLPAAGVMAGIAVHSITQVLVQKRWGMPWTLLPILLFAAACATSMFRQKAFLFELDPSAACQETYDGNPFPEAIGIGNYVHAHTSPDDRIAVLGSEPEIYFYARRHSATGFIYIYGLMEPQKYAADMQKEMISEIEAAQPKFVIYIASRLSWLPRNQHQLLAFVRWAQGYLREYELVGIADRVGDHTVYLWDDAAKTYRPQSESAVWVYRRKG